MQVEVKEKKTAAEIFHNPVTAWLILFCGIAATVLAWFISREAVIKRAELRFYYRADEIKTAIFDRMNGYEQVLWGGVGLMNASEHVSRKEWRDYVSTLEINQHWPGIQAIGYSVPVKSGDLKNHIESIRAEGFSEYAVKPAGERGEYSSIIYIEPFDWRNRRAFGFDMWSNAMRREAMARARDSGVAATSGAITLVQETDENVQKGFLTYVPVYTAGAPVDNVDERRKHFQGWVYAAFRAEDLMHGTLGTNGGNIDFAIYDGSEMSEDRLIYSTYSTSKFSQEEERDFTIVDDLDLQGRNWTFLFKSKPGYITSGERSISTYIAIAGITIDLLLFYVITSLVFVQSKAKKIAKKMTVDLHETQEELKVKIDELDRKSKDLERSNADLEQFAYIASHDLQEPLRKIQMFSSMLEEELPESLDAQAKSYINRMNTSASRMSELIKGLLDYSRSDSARLELTDVDLNETLSDVMTDLESLTKRTSAEVVSDPLPVVKTDSVQISQVFQNLITNAIKFQKPNVTPIVEISFCENEDNFEILFKDNGIGFENDCAERIFQIFGRLHSKSEYEGTGIGLALCKRLVERQGGSIRADGKVGEGATFVISLPK